MTDIRTDISDSAGDKPTSPTGDRITNARGAHGGRALERGQQPPKAHYDIDPETGCWNWNRAIGNAGYGSTRYAGQSVAAHRAYHAHYNGPIPAGHVVMHSCDNRRCVNPAHLSVGTQQANLDDAKAKGRTRAPRGEASHLARLTSADIVPIFEMRATGMLHREIAARYGVSTVAITCILSRKHHQDVPVPPELVRKAQAVNTRMSRAKRDVVDAVLAERARIRGAVIAWLETTDDVEVLLAAIDQEGDHA